MKETLLKVKSHIKHHTFIVGDFSIPLSPLDRRYQQKFNRAIIKLTDIMTQIDLRDNYRTFTQTQKNIIYLLFSTSYNLFQN